MKEYLKEILPCRAPRSLTMNENVNVNVLYLAELPGVWKLPPMSFAMKKCEKVLYLAELPGA